MREVRSSVAQIPNSIGRLIFPDCLIDVGERTGKTTKKEIELQSKLDLVHAFREAEIATENEQRPGVWKIGMDASDWLDAAAPHCSTPAGVVFVDPTCSSKSVVEEICVRATSFDEDDRLAIAKSDIDGLQALWAVRGTFDCRRICDSIAETMKEKGTEQTEEAAISVVKCIDLLHALRISGEASAEAILRDDDTALVLLNAWTNAVAVGAQTSPIMASLLYSHPQMDVNKQFGSVNEATRNKITQIRKSAGLSESGRIWEKLREYQVFQIAGALAGGKGGAAAGQLMGDMIEIATAEGNVNLAVPSWFPRINAGWLRNQFENREIELSEIVSQLEQSSDVLDDLVTKGKSTKAEDRECVELFLEFGKIESKRAICQSFGEELRSIESETWEKDLSSDRTLIHFANQVQAYARKSVVGSPFKTAIKRAALSISNNEFSLSDDDVKSLHKIIERMSPSFRKELGKQFLNEINRNEGGLTAECVAAFGQAMLDAALNFRPEDLARLVARSLDGSNIELLVWIVSFLKHQDVVLAGVESDAHDLLGAELNSAEQAASSEEALEQLNRLRSMFSLPRSDESDEDLESEEENSEPEETEVSSETGKGAT